MALLHGYAALAESAPQESHHFRIAREHLEQAIERLGYLANNPWFFSGYSGVAWTVDHFIHMGLVEEGDEDLNDEIDKALMDFLSHDPWIGLPELIAGAAGIGLYGLDRGGRGRGPEIVRRVIDILFQKAEQTPHGIAWFDPPELLHYVSRERHPNGFFNLGTSHGNPGVIGFLAEAAYRGDVRARALLDASMSWLLACRDLFQDGSLFGTGFARGEKTNAHGSRLSWCYGDLGISEVILLAARRTGNPSWEIEALKVAGACATRPNPRSAVCDAGLCHGAFGNAHLFARLYNATADAVFSGVAQNFYEMGLDLRRETPEAGGFLAFHAPRVEDPMQDTWIPKTGLLEGSAGIGLALLAATTPIEPLWDRQILAHVPPVLV
jgi:lantibiotic modifying enzyme